MGRVKGRSKWFREDWKWVRKRDYYDRTIHTDELGSVVDQLSYYRKRSGLSMKAMADKMGYHYQSVFKWENKKYDMRWEAVERWCYIMKLRIVIVAKDSYWDGMLESNHHVSTYKDHLRRRREGMDFTKCASMLKPRAKNLCQMLEPMRKHFKVPRTHVARHLGISSDRLKGMESGRFYIESLMMEAYLDYLHYRIVIVPCPNEDLVVTKHWRKWNSK